MAFLCELEAGTPLLRMLFLVVASVGLWKPGRRRPARFCTIPYPRQDLRKLGTVSSFPSVLATYLFGGVLP